MPVLIDGYNLYHYARSVYQEEQIDLPLTGFCQIVDEWARRSHHKALMVFDGSVPPALRSTRYGSVHLEFAGGGADADSVIERYIAENSAPKMLTVVSSDRRLRKTAKRRNCKIFTSNEFWAKVVRKLTTRPPRPEPREKTSGLVSHEREYWLKIFGLE